MAGAMIPRQWCTLQVHQEEDELGSELAGSRLPYQKVLLLQI